MAVNEMNTCNNCKYYRQGTRNDTIGQCKRYPPTIPELPPVEGRTHRVTLWPIVYHYDLCGEWKEKEVTDGGE